MKTFGGNIPRPIKNRYQKKTNIISAKEKAQEKKKKRNRKAAKAARKARKS
ncbi:MAG: hypothetical protein ACW97P_13690 [Candidatus Hodarchaeales archaeon]|jgi:hypothetical protein